MNTYKNNIKPQIRYGKIISVRGSVVEVAFYKDLPPIYSLLFSGKDMQVSIKVLSGGI